MGDYQKGWTHNEKFSQKEWDEIETGNAVPLPRGLYLAEVVAAKPKETKTGKPAIAVNLKVLKRYGSKEPLERNKHVFDTMTVAKDTLFKVKQFCEATDMEPLLTQRFDEVKQFAKDMLETEVWIVVSVRTHEKKEQNNVEHYVSEDELAEVGASMSDGDPERPTRRKKKGEKPSQDDADEDEDEDEDEEEEKPRKSRRRRAASPPDEEDDEDDEDDEDEDEGPRPAKKRKASKKKKKGKNKKKKKEEEEDADDDVEDIDEEDEEEEPPKRKVRRRRRQSEQE